MTQHVGTVYNTTIQEVTGSVALGAGAQAPTEGSSVEEVLALLDRLHGQAHERELAEVAEAVADLRDEVARGADTGTVIKKAGRLKQLAQSVGLPVMAAASTGAVEAVTNLALSGMFG